MAPDTLSAFASKSVGCFFCLQVIVMVYSKEYDDYLKSEEWRVKRYVTLELAEHRCQVCYSDKELHVHHRTYKNFGKEHHSDLTVLCNHCHSLHHLFFGAIETLKINPKKEEHLEYLVGVRDRESDENMILLASEECPVFAVSGKVIEGEEKLVEKEEIKRLTDQPEERATKGREVSLLMIEVINERSVKSEDKPTIKLSQWLVHQDDWPPMPIPQNYKEWIDFYSLRNDERWIGYDIKSKAASMNSLWSIACKRWKDTR